MLKVTHIITGLETGGAEMMLYKLLKEMSFGSRVISLTQNGPVGEKIEALGIPIQLLGMHPNFPNPLAIWHLARWLRQDQPDLVQTWLYHGDLVGGIAAKLAGNIPVIWNVRGETLSPHSAKRRTIWLQKLAAHLSKSLPKKIIFNSEIARQGHIQLGYDETKTLTIPNGFELDSFKPDPIARQMIRQSLDIEESCLLVGYIARFHPQKDHATFFKAAALLGHHIRFLLCGDGITWENNQLVEWIEEAGLRDRVYLLGRRADTPQINACLDLAVLTANSGEGFPNVLGEAMACGVPCVASEVGDARFIIGDTGSVVPPSDPQALACAWQTILEMPPAKRQELGLAARQRIIDNFSLPVIAARYEALYRQCVE